MNAVSRYLKSLLLLELWQGLGVTLVDPFTLSSDDGTGYVVRPFAPVILLDMFIVTARARPLSAIGREFLEDLERRLARMAWQPD